MVRHFWSYSQKKCSCGQDKRIFFSRCGQFYCVDLLLEEFEKSGFTLVELNKKGFQPKNEHWKKAKA
jgi:hypothetical protein